MFTWLLMINWSIKGYPNDIEMLLTGIPSFRTTLCCSQYCKRDSKTEIDSKGNTSHATPPPLQKIKKKNRKSLDINIQLCFQPKVYFHSNIVLATAAKCAQKKPWQMLVIFTRCHCSKILIYFPPCRTTVCSHFHRNVHWVYQSLPSTHIAPSTS